ncbi:MAG: CDP-alcohol phosphatidyltransferase family protein [Bacteroidia bacterium]|nr:CDP-alcohol phosphatidyltransferase family protein [Bacteroidia bacterium]MCZ2277780.1 CDP-alcohol phosphatidyltransferase family protein [Bacteroidia bacterium]
MLKEIASKTAYKILQPLVNALVRAGVSPNTITTTGLLLNVAAAVIFIMGAEYGSRGDLNYVGWGGFMILFAGLFDMLDGQVARASKTSSKFGALYDSVLDRYSELIMFLGICYYLVAQSYFLSSIIAFLAMIGSIMVSYVRARGEGLGIPCSVGLMQRPERIVIVGTSAIACGIASNYIGGDFKVDLSPIPFHVFETITIFSIPMFFVALLANLTALSRLNHCRKVLQNKDMMK